MYFIIFLCVVLIIKAILRLTWYKNDTNFSYYDNISNIFIGILLFVYVLRMKMNSNVQTISMPAFAQSSVFTTPNVSPMSSSTPSLSGFSENSNSNSIQNK